MKRILTRDVPKKECPWLTKGMKEGEEVYDYTEQLEDNQNYEGYILCSLEENKLPFFELPANAFTLKQ